MLPSTGMAFYLAGKEAWLGQLRRRLSGIPDLTYQIDRNVVTGTGLQSPVP